MNQEEAQKLLDKIYTPEKKKIWDKEMGEIGKKFEDGKVSCEELMEFRAKLRKRLGFPA